MKRNINLLVLTLSVFFLTVEAISRGDIILQDNFDGDPEEAVWRGFLGPLVQLVLTDRSSHALRIERKQLNSSSTFVNVPLPATLLQGCKLRVRATVKAENISALPNPWNGVKVMIHAKGPNGENWPQQNLPQGTFDWTTVDYIANIPKDANQAILYLGLEAVTGVAWFDDMSIIVYNTPRVVPLRPPPGLPYKGHNLTRLRGVMTGINLQEQDFRDLATWNANHVRWQLIWNGFPNSPADDGDLASYNVWIESALRHLDSMLPICQQLGIHILIDLHTPPGGRNSVNECNLFKEKRFQDAFISLWEKIAYRYRNESIVWGYDLVNEPVEGVVSDILMDWRQLAITTVERIRTIDSMHAIIIEAGPWGGPDALSDFDPLPFNNIVYSFHMYEPHAFTHQNVYNNVPPITYPGMISGQMWNKEQLRHSMNRVLDWQRDYNVHIHVGEFSAIRWAPGDSAYAYLRDVIEIFEENAWDWVYHAFREWPGWSVEHIGDKNHTQYASFQTDRQKLLIDWFKTNEH